MLNLQQTTILLVENDPGHARLIEKNLRRAEVKNKIVNLVDGQQLIGYLFNSKTDPETPLLVLLDLNLPVLDGYQVLRKMKANPKTRAIPVIILTTTDNIREVNRCYHLGCNFYMTKPVEYERLSNAIWQLGKFLAVTTLPTGE